MPLSVAAPSVRHRPNQRGAASPAVAAAVDCPCAFEQPTSVQHPRMAGQGDDAQPFGTRAELDAEPAWRRGPPGRRTRIARTQIGAEKRRNSFARSCLPRSVAGDDTANPVHVLLPGGVLCGGLNGLNGLCIDAVALPVLDDAAACDDAAGSARCAHDASNAASTVVSTVSSRAPAARRADIVTVTSC